MYINFRYPVIRSEDLGPDQSERVKYWDSTSWYSGRLLPIVGAFALATLVTLATAIVTVGFASECAPLRREARTR